MATLLEDGAGALVIVCDELVVCDEASPTQICCPCPTGVQTLFPVAGPCGPVSVTLLGWAERTEPTCDPDPLSVCGSCSDLNDDFELPANANDCIWGDLFEDFYTCHQFACHGGGTVSMDVDIDLQLQCCAVGDGTYYLGLFGEVRLIPCNDGGTCPGGPATTWAQYWKRLAHFDPDDGCVLTKLVTTTLDFLTPAAAYDCGTASGYSNGSGLHDCDPTGSSLRLNI